MTAIVGFTCTDGVLLLSDTEETTSGFTKSDCDKLYRFTFPDGTVLTGGAGNGHLIDCANQELHMFFATGKSNKLDLPVDGELIRTALNEFAEDFFERTTASYAQAGMEPPPGFEMLIAVNCRKKETLLFRWALNRVLWIAPSRHDCIGSGVIQMHPMLRDFQFVPTIETALFCGMRMMFHAKRIVQGVGGKTHAIALFNNGTTMYFGTENTEKIEELVSNFEGFLGKFVYISVSNVSKKFAEIEENASKAFADLPAILQQYRDRYKELLHNPVL